MRYKTQPDKKATDYSPYYKKSVVTTAKKYDPSCNLTQQVVAAQQFLFGTTERDIITYRIFRDHHNLSLSCVGGFGWFVSHQESKSYLFEAVIKLIDKFDASKGYAASTYLVAICRGLLMNARRSEIKRRGELSNREFDVDLDGSFIDIDGNPVDVDTQFLEFIREEVDEGSI